MEKILVRKWQSPFGEMLIGSCRDTLCLCDWSHADKRERKNKMIARALGGVFAEGTDCVIEKAITELSEYFLHARREFEIPVLFCGTGFQQSVWKELMRIPYGATSSYKDIAVRIGKPKAVRAVANAVATNPISVFVPCHRVVGADNSLTGFDAGLTIKQSLLSIESASRFL